MQPSAKYDLHASDTLPASRYSLRPTAQLLDDKVRKIDPGLMPPWAPSSKRSVTLAGTILVTRFDKPCRPLQVLNRRLTPYKSNMVRGNLSPPEGL
jgi:hypothetical protein